jgi:multiple sugar transport system substrate-binding protein
MVKKGVIILLVLTLIIPVFFVSSGFTKDRVQVRFWKFTDTFADATIEKYIKLWNQSHPDIEVIFETFPWGDYTGTKLSSAFATGQGPDVFFISPGDLLRYVNAGLAQPLEKYLSTEEIKDFLPATIQSVKVSGHIFAIPLEMEPVAIFYNKKIFKDLGLQEPKIWSELLDTAHKLRKGEKYGIIVDVAPGYYQNFTWYPFIWSAGGDVISKDWKRALMTSQSGVSALKLWGDFIKEDVAPKTLPGSGPDITMLGNGIADMMVCGFWGVKPLQADFPKYDFGVFPIPPIDNKHKSISVYGGWRLMVNAKSKNVEEAVKFAKWMGVDQIDFPLEWCTVANSKFSPRKSVLKAGEKYYSTPPNDIFSKVLQTARSEPAFPPEIVKAVSDAIQGVMFGGLDAKVAAKQAETSITDFLKNYKGGIPGM